jgi:superfamily I DNA and/or RNA helicase
MQLRPKVQNYQLSVENSNPLTPRLDVSLFERLCFDGVPSTSKTPWQIPFTKLTVQRRMRPQIADLVRLPLYNDLLDHPSVLQYPRVYGMYDNIYWLDHQHHEDGQDQFDVKGTSHSNMYEVKMVTQLVLHLAKQDDYRGEDVVVLTPYLGQLRKLRDSLERTFCVELSEVDTEEVKALEGREDSILENSKIAESRRPLSQSMRIATV